MPDAAAGAAGGSLEFIGVRILATVPPGADLSAARVCAHANKLREGGPGLYIHNLCCVCIAAHVVW